MKKGMAFFLSAVMAVSALIPNALAAAQNDEQTRLKTKISASKAVRSQASLRGANESATGSIFIEWDANKDIPRFVSGDLGNDKVSNAEEAVRFLNDNKDVFNMSHGAFVLKSVFEDKVTNTKHYKTQITVNGIPVYGAEIVLHTNANNQVYAINGQAEPAIEDKEYMEGVKLTAQEAIKKAESEIGIPAGFESYTAEPKTNLWLYQTNQGWKVVFEAVLQFIEPYPANWSIFVDASSGEIVDKFNQVTCETGTGVGTLGDSKTINITNQSGKYVLIDTTKTARIETYNGNYGTSLPGTIYSDTDTNFNAKDQGPAVDAHYYAGLVVDYYKNVHGRNGYDNRGSTVRSTVHHQRNFNNAFWNGSQMAYGDGDGSTFGPFSAALDVVAHELTHAVTNFSANLTYKNQSGALNESFSDVFGTIIEGDTNDWDCGEDIYTPSRPGDALRSLKQPSLYKQPEHMSQYVNTTQDEGGVHINSGIPNKAFYNIASVIGFEKSSKIYYKALTQYLVNSSQFADCRTALMQSAADLYGKDSEAYYMVQKGYADVGIGSQPPKPTVTPSPTATPTPSPTPTPAVFKISGFIRPDLVSSNAQVKAGFNVSLQGTSKSGTTDNKGYFTIENIPLNSQGYTLAMEKSGYLKRTISISGNESLTIGTELEPIDLWAGDMPVDGIQDQAINMTDILKILEGFNSVSGDGKYKVDYDLDLDNSINMTDILIAIMHFNTTPANYPPAVIVKPTATPIPTASNTPTPTSTIKPTPTPIQGEYPAWNPNSYSYQIGDKVSYNGNNYECVMAHVSNAGWDPVNAFTLWKKI
ncbi:MAG: M4 family metallopeptidase [Clostridia bacterium]|nr:M4 family metallopeptidase [Clostridia bacterium]